MRETRELIHPTAVVSPDALIGEGTCIWHHAHVREGAAIGSNCIIGQNAYIDFEVEVGDNVKIQNGASIYHGAKIEDGVFIGPQACLANDRFPRAITPEGQLQGAQDWSVGPILIQYGASVGAGAIVLPDVTIGRFGMVAAGAVVTRDVPEHALVMGVPAQISGYVCRCGRRMVKQEARYYCTECDWSFLPREAEA